MTKQQTDCTCAMCDSKLIGRSDKVFCGIECKNEHHKATRLTILAELLMEEKTLKRNLVILRGLVSKKGRRIRIHYKLLFKLGFDLLSFQASVQKAGKAFNRIDNYFFRKLPNGFVELTNYGANEVDLESFLERWKMPFGRRMRIEGEGKYVIFGLSMVIMSVYDIQV